MHYIAPSAGLELRAHNYGNVGTFSRYCAEGLHRAGRLDAEILEILISTLQEPLIQEKLVHEYWFRMKSKGVPLNTVRVWHLWR